MNIKNINWFVVSGENMAVIAGLFKRDNFVPPSPRCFGRPVNPFDLGVASVPQVRKQPQWKLALDRITGLFF